MTRRNQPTNPSTLKGLIQAKLKHLEGFSPREIKDEIAGHRRGIMQPTGLLANWLTEQLGQTKVSLRTQQNVLDNLVVEVDMGEFKAIYTFLVGTSLQEFLEIKKKSDVVSSFRLSDEQSIVLRALVDREGGDEAKVLRAVVNLGFANLPVIGAFVEQVAKHPAWHPRMHEAGLYPSDIAYAWGKIQDELKE